MDTDTLGIFGHHPNPADDFLIECEVIEGLAYNVSVGLDAPVELKRHLSRALDFRVALPECLRAKDRLREIAATIGV